MACTMRLVFSGSPKRTVIGYDPGSRGKRYVGFGMGASRLFVTLRYSDMKYQSDPL
jgi:hypothetical protein